MRAVTSSVGTLAAANQGQLTIDLKPINQRKRSADQIARDLTRRSRGVAGHLGLHPEPAGDLDRRPRVEEPVPVHAAERRHRRSSTSAARSSRRGCAQLPMLTDVTSDLLIDNPQVTIDIDREAAGAARRFGGRNREHALRRVRPAAGVDDLHVDQRVLGRHGGPAAIPAGHHVARLALCVRCASGAAMPTSCQLDGARP